MLVKKLIILSVILFLIVKPASPQTIISGKVTDASTFEPVPFANVIFKGTTIGTKTDFNGCFGLTGTLASDSIIISFIGYTTKRIGIRQGENQVIDVQLHPALFTLSEVKITPGENPAHIILKKFWENSETNSIDRLDSFSYRNYSRTTVYLRKFGNKPDSLRWFTPFGKEFENYSVRTGSEDIPALPSYITETISDNFRKSSTGQEFTNIIATNSNGIAFDNSDLVSQLISRQENFYFPGSIMKIADKSFISPLSRTGIFYYKYSIQDTLFIDDRYYCYEIRVVPRREEDPVFWGTIWINDSTFALKRISVEISGKAELNFIQRVRILQDYEPSAGGAWFPVNTRFMADAVNIFVTNFSNRSNISLEIPDRQEFYGSELKTQINAPEHNAEYWNEYRTKSLDRIDSLAFSRIESLRNNRKVRFSAKAVEASIKGYFNLGCFEAGPWIMLYDFNDVEGSRIRLGGRTNSEFSKSVILDGYLAYGFRDKRIKGSLKTEFFLSKEYWTKLGLNYQDDIENTGAIDEFFSGSSFLSFASTFGGSENMNRSRVARIWLESDISSGLTGKVLVSRKEFNAVSDGFNPVWFADEVHTRLSSDFVTTEIGIVLRYQPRSVYAIDGVRRFPVNFNKYPVFRLEFFKGFNNFLDGEFDYRKVYAGISHHFSLGGLGDFEYDLGYTTVDGQLPYPLLITLAGNESIFRTSRTYNLMNLGEFVLDEALEFYASYRMNGLILNKMPVIKGLQWRSVVSLRAAAGDFNEKLNGYYNPSSNPDGILFMPSGVPLNEFNTLAWDKPYAEISYGIENIFRVIRIDLVQRLTYTNLADTDKFGIRLSGQFRF